MTKPWDHINTAFRAPEETDSTGEEETTALLVLHLLQRLSYSFKYYFNHETWSLSVSGSWNLFFKSLVCAAQICVCDVPWRCDQEHDKHTAGRCEYIKF